LKPSLQRWHGRARARELCSFGRVAEKRDVVGEDLHFRCDLVEGIRCRSSFRVRGRGRALLGARLGHHGWSRPGAKAFLKVISYVMDGEMARTWSARSRSV
jgi:hypothetical protein